MMAEHQDWAMEDEGPQDTHDVVRDGETMPEFAARVGVPVEDVVRLNERQLQDEARARGFQPMFYRESVGEDGARQRDPEYHAFAGLRLRVREDPEG